MLKGHIQLSTAVWPKGVKGSALDCMARMHLWQAGLNYRHGTGHGVGSFLNVHEGQGHPLSDRVVLPSDITRYVILFNMLHAVTKFRLW